MTFNFVQENFHIGQASPDLSPQFIFYKKGFRIGGNASIDWREVTLSGVGALTLTNALTDSLLSLKLFGATEQRNIPSEYTQVEYLESIDTQYIDTGIVPTKNTKIEIHNIQKVTDTAFGVAEQLYTFNTGSTNYYCFGGGANSGSYTGTSLVNLDATIVMSKDDGLVINGQQAVAFSDVSDFTTDLTFWLFARNNTTTRYKMGAQRTYYFKMWDNGILIQNLIPCKRNSDNVLGMYDTVTGNFLTNQGTGTFTAGADVTPSPDYPMNIVSNNGAVKVSRNLLDKNGEFIEFNSAADYIGIAVPNGTYTCSTNIPQSSMSDRNAWFDNQNTTFSSTANGVSSVASRTVTTSIGMIYFAIRKSYKSGLLDGTYWVQIEKGSTATAYTPYSATGYYTDGTVETVDVHGKNLFDINNVTIQADTSIGSDGSLVPNVATKVCITYLPVKPNTTYTISGDVLGSNTAFFRIAQYKSDKTFLGRSEDSTGQRSSYTFTTGADTYFVRFHCITEANLNTYQLELGSTATTYEPYTVLGTATAEMLLKVGTYQDVQSVINGSVTRNIGIKVLDGTEDWEDHRTYSNIKVLSITGSYTGGAIAITSTHYVGTSALNANMPVNSIKLSIPGASDVNGSVYVKTDSLTLANFKTYLASQYNAGTPVIIVYPLATATTETVTAQSLTIQAGTNMVEITQASMDNLGLEVSYKATV